MSYYAAPQRRPVRRKKDSTPVVLAVITALVVPALGYAVYKLVIDKPSAVEDDSSAYVAVNTIPAAPPPKQHSAEALPKPPSANPTPDVDSKLFPAFANPSAFVRPSEDGEFSSNFTPSTGGNQFSQFSGGSMGGGGQSAAAAVADAGKKIKESVDLGKTLVIWLVDRTPSCEARRQEVVKQLESLYPTLAPPAAAGAKAEEAKLLTAVCSFAADVQYATKEPTADPAEVRNAMSSITTDQGNVENTFKAIETAVGQYASFAAPPHQRYITVVVVTDEVGNDQHERDRVVDLVRKNSIPVYVIGSSAAFGSTGAQAASSEGAGGQVTGPESRDVEWVNLQFPGGMSIGGPVGGDCGVGPYSLTHLCRESSGEYFAVGSYGPSVMLPAQYRPKYLSERDYQAQVGGNKAMAALFAAAKLPPAKQISGPRSSFEVDENGLAVVRDIDMAQRPVALIIPEVINLHETLKKGESDRAKIVEPRHQAAYDLALGRAMAARVRAEGYVVLVAAFKSGRKTSKGAGVWSIMPADGIEKNSVLDGMGKKARQYLEDVIKNHPGTPWAAAAQQELSQPIGWVWQES